MDDIEKHCWPCWSYEAECVCRMFSTLTKITKRDFNDRH